MGKPTHKNVRINKILSNGLFIINARLQSGVAIFSVSDFMNDSRITLDYTNKKIVANRDDIELNKVLIDELFETIRTEVEIKK